MGKQCTNFLLIYFDMYICIQYNSGPCTVFLSDFFTFQLDVRTPAGRTGVRRTLHSSLPRRCGMLHAR